jgi:hypothetical protein
MVDGLLNRWVGDLMDELLSCMGRCLKTVMKQLTVVIENGNDLVEKISNIEFCIYGHSS